MSHARWGRVGLVLVLAIGLACSEQSPSGTRSRPGEAQPAALALVDGRPVGEDEVRGPVALDLFELEQARHRLLAESLERRIAERLGAAVAPGSEAWHERVEIRLEPPPRLRVEIPEVPGPLRGPASAPVRIDHFVDYESPHAGRIHASLAGIRERYPSRVSLAVHDLPRPYHRRAWPAARAARCAGDQGRYWAYHDLLLLDPMRLSEPELLGRARDLGLDEVAFTACVSSNRYDGHIARSLAIGEGLGVHRAGTVFVNGLYLSGRPELETIDRVVRDELERLGFPTATSTGPAAAVPESADAEPSGAVRTLDSDGPDRPRLPLEAHPEPAAVITLSREEVTLALRDRRALDRQLEASRGEFSGERLLKLGRVEPGDFFSRLGLEAGDVLMLVDGAFVTAGGEPIWAAFEEGDSLTLLVMRRGLPRTHRYRIR